jgi:hypothetical protein
MTIAPCSNFVPTISGAFSLVKQVQGHIWTPLLSITIAFEKSRPFSAWRANSEAGQLVLTIGGIAGVPVERTGYCTRPTQVPESRQ